MTEKTPFATRMDYAEKILYGKMRTAEVVAETGASSGAVSSWCEKYAKGRVKVARKHKQRWFGSALNGTGPKHTITTKATTEPVSISTKTTKGGEWSITIGEYRLTLDKEPNLMMLERIWAATTQR